MISVSKKLLAIERIHNKIGMIWMANEHRMNALNTAMLHELKDSLEQLEEDSQIKCIIISGKGKHFSIGVELDEIRNRVDLPPIDSVFSKLKKPVIAAVNGYAVSVNFCYCRLAWRRI